MRAEAGAEGVEGLGKAFETFAGRRGGGGKKVVRGEIRGRGGEMVDAETNEADGGVGLKVAVEQGPSGVAKGEVVAGRRGEGRLAGNGAEAGVANLEAGSLGAETETAEAASDIAGKRAEILAEGGAVEGVLGVGVLA